MLLDNFVKENSFHDSFIVKAKYDLQEKILSIGLVQLFSELSIKSEIDIDIKPDDQVEVEIQLEGIEYISQDIINLEDNEIYSVDYGIIGKYDILMIQLLDEGLYKEIYIRGCNIRINAKILGVYSN
jgi:hypothetical protein